MDSDGPGTPAQQFTNDSEILTALAFAIPGIPNFEYSEAKELAILMLAGFASSGNLVAATNRLDVVEIATSRDSNIPVLSQRSPSEVAKASDLHSPEARLSLR